MLTRRPSAYRGLSLAHAKTRASIPSRLGHPCRACLPPAVSVAALFAPARSLLTRPGLPPRRRRDSASIGSSYGSVTNRPLATAMDDSLLQHDDMFPRSMPSSPGVYHPYSPPRPPLAFDPSSPLVVKPRYEPLPRYRATSTGIPSAMDEMLSIFHACLQVGNLERAAHFLDRIGTLDGAIASDEIIVLHNHYLRACIDRALQHPGSPWAQTLHTWYELQIRAKDLPQTTETIACMLKVSILSAKDDKLKRLVKRYVEHVPGEEFMGRILESDILTQQDVGTIGSIHQPASNFDFEYLDVPGTTAEEDLPSLDAGMAASKTDTPTAKVSTMSETPDVLPVPQKGLGLKSLRGVLSFFQEIDGQDLSKLPETQRREIQARLEKDCVESAIARWREEKQSLTKMGRTTSISAPALNSQLYNWQCALEQNLQAELETIKTAERPGNLSQPEQHRAQYGPYLLQSTPSRLAAVTILSVLNSIAQGGSETGVNLTAVMNNVARGVEEDIRQQVAQAEAAKKSRARRVARAHNMSQTSTASPPTPEASIESAAPKTANPNLVECSPYDLHYWPTLIKARVGAVLMAAFVDSAKVTVVREHPETKALVSQFQPAVAHSTIHRKGKKVGVILPNQVLVDMLKREPRGDFLTRHLPMLVEPEPWTRYDKGGFLHTSTQLVRIKAGEQDQRIYTEAAVERGDMKDVGKALDVLGRTGWQVNHSVFDVMLEAWNSGEEFANIPALEPNIESPPEPEKSEDNFSLRREWLRAVRTAENLKSGLHSERCFMNFQLEIARAFKDQTFYFPHNMDFRGRAYPIPTYLNHMGADHVRGLLRFSRGKPLGEKGLKWLKVQLANVFGFDKASLEERAKFAEDHMADIEDSVTSPLNGARWWLKAEDPWQCLAACFELKAALDSPDPSQFVSHLPVHQDGTCNGLQHYAALGGDLWGAQQVNLVPSDRPADVYSSVAELVKKSIAEDLKTGDPCAKAVNGKITRKVVKQTVMTNVYGVTFAGAREQVLKQIKDLYPRITEETGIPMVMISSYIATKIFKGLSTMFRGAHDIQHWLGECAGRVCRSVSQEQIQRIKQTEQAPQANLSGRKKAKAKPHDLLEEFRSTIVWTTPLRMPVVQPYRKSGTRVISTSLQDLKLTAPERSDPVHRRKQLQGFPPNFIHSLDASHMLLSALECDERGLNFAAVHDSFWTHAGDIDTMNQVLRDAFVRIHSEDVIGRLASEFKARYRNSLYLARGESDDADLRAKITAWRRKARLTLRQELVQEQERQALLASSDPEEVQRGKEMVTPGSLFEQSKSARSQEIYASPEAEVPSPEDLASMPVEHAENFASDDALVEGEDVDTKTKTKTTKKSGNDELDALVEETIFSDILTGKSKSKTRANNPLVAWVPLRFPEVPEKGGFDVSALRQSDYFFS